VVFFDLRALADPSQLRQRIAGVRLVLGTHDAVLVSRREDANLDELRVGKEVQADEIGAGFFERGKVFLDRALGAPLKPAA
jgi:hypothetical protein